MDAASLELIDALVSDTNNHRLLFIGAYRENEVDDTHPLWARLRLMEKSENVNIHTLHVGGLRLDHVNEMIADTLNMQKDEVAALAAVVHGKTMGNVFFVITFLKALAELKMLKFNFGTFQWTFDLEDINKSYVTANVADVLLTRLERVPIEQSQLLAISSCLGTPFDTSTLMIVVTFLQDVVVNGDRTLSFLAVTPENVQTSIEKNVSEGYLEQASQPGRDSFRFSHDKIQEAGAYH